MVAGQTIGIAGAGSIGCFVGGMLAAGGRRVALLGRARVIAEIEAGGLRPTFRIPQNRPLRVSCDGPKLSHP